MPSRYLKKKNLFGSLGHQDGCCLILAAEKFHQNVWYSVVLVLRPNCRSYWWQGGIYWHKINKSAKRVKTKAVTETMIKLNGLELVCSLSSYRLISRSINSRGRFYCHSLLITGKYDWENYNSSAPYASVLCCQLWFITLVSHDQEGNTTNCQCGTQHGKPAAWSAVCVGSCQLKLSLKRRSSGSRRRNS